MRYVWATATHQGRVRRRNEDAVYPDSSGASELAILVGVADGMGGAIAGNVASSTALEAAVTRDPQSDVSMVERIVAGNDELLGEIERDPDLRGMGTTLTLGLFRPNGTLELGHVGDSRAYRLRSNEIELLTEYIDEAQLVVGPESGVDSGIERALVVAGVDLADGLEADHVARQVVHHPDHGVLPFRGAAMDPSLERQGQIR